MSFQCIVKNTMAEMKNLSAAEITDLQNGVYKGVCLQGYYEKGDTPAPVIYYLSSTAGTDDAGSIIETGGIKLEHNFAHDLDVSYFGVKGDGTYNDTPFILSYFKYVNANNLYWVIPGKCKVVVKQSFEMKTSGRCDGKFILIKENSEVAITVARRFNGEVVDISAWEPANMKRGSLDVGFSNKGIANLNFNSNEVLIERAGADSYTKREFIRTNNGQLTTPLVCDYNVKDKLTVTKYVVEEAIVIDNLYIEAAVNLNDYKYLFVNRDNVTLNNPRIINNIDGKSGGVGLEIMKCADVLINSPFIKGFNKEGVGYGIVNYESIGVVINDGNVVECRHGYTGCYSVDVTINRGVWEEGIDDHWTDRFTINNPTIKTGFALAAFQFAGNDITINSAVVNGKARLFFGIRYDTPSLGGIININNPIFNTYSVEDIYLFALTSPGGITDPQGFSEDTKPKFPDSINIIKPIINTDAKLIYCYNLGAINTEYTNVKHLKITDTILTAKAESVYVAALIIKDSINQKKRNTTIEIEGRLTTNVINTKSVYIYSRTNDYDNRADVFLRNCFGYKTFRFGGFGIKNVIVDGGEIVNFENDNTFGDFSTSNIQFKNVEWKGGTIENLSHTLFQSCVFTGNYVFSSADQVSFANNIKYASVSGLPANIVNSMKPPFV
ncbi:hypothetical protein CRN76_19095 [Chryseobacterium indologenes]|uniref:hypothetical protein n=1 Tax=Chryseobacterium indologenes TaxID=253 RepID=UPI000BFE30C7|nr:hypothetical protein [Chryseobacterium indologenes]ATN07347.1 hypothetical protein CRN76_19095 [Chryseobacterium indologenes]AYY83905.1 hypothetical protein EGX91_04685 [Chryseobacterium indologenes]QIX80832.1 hypothetical protein FOB56_06095 [Chryseobacterium indologenes]UDQ54497.1 hypothetical protein LJF28_02205 [Chryseobacterium indologenes]